MTEIYCHPGLYADPELKRWAPRYHRQEELAALDEPGLKAAAGRRRGEADGLPGNGPASRKNSGA